MAVKELIGSIIGEIVDKDFVIETTHDDSRVAIRLHKNDVARVVGRGGKTSRAIRAVVSAYAKSRNASVSVSIEEREVISD